VCAVSCRAPADNSRGKNRRDRTGEGACAYVSLLKLLTSAIIMVCLIPPGRTRKGNLVLMIRLSRTGARKQPQYRVVVIEKERARNGRSVEVVGTYNPRGAAAHIDLKRDRIDYWVSKGAKMSDRVSKLFAKPVPEPASAGPAA